MRHAFALSDGSFLRFLLHWRLTGGLLSYFLRSVRFSNQLPTPIPPSSLWTSKHTHTHWESFHLRDLRRYGWHNRGQSYDMRIDTQFIQEIFSVKYSSCHLQPMDNSDNVVASFVKTKVCTTLTLSKQSNLI